jgi:hypothetical protein
MVGSGVPVLISATMRCAGLLLDFRQGAQELGAVGRVGDVVVDGGGEQRAEILRGVGQRGVRADGDALHALGAVFGDVERGFAAGDVLGGRVAGGGGDDAHGRERRGGLVVAIGGAELGVEGGDGADGSARALAGGTGVERQPVLHPPAVASSRMGSSAWPRRLERSAAVSAPILISLTCSKPWVMTSMLDLTTASPSLPNFLTYCL